MTQFLPTLPLLLILFVSGLAGCTFPEKGAEPLPRKQVYVDANLQFEISLPEQWSQAQRPLTLQPLSKQTTTWYILRQNQTEVRLRLSVLSLPANQNPRGYNGLKQLIEEQYPDFSVDTSEAVTLPAGAGLRIGGRTTRDLFEIWLFLGGRRHYIISCSAAKPVFDSFRLQFRQVADSFSPLE